MTVIITDKTGLLWTYRMTDEKVIYRDRAVLRNMGSLLKKFSRYKIIILIDNYLVLYFVLPVVVGMLELETSCRQLPLYTRDIRTTCTTGIPPTTSRWPLWRREKKLLFIVVTLAFSILILHTQRKKGK